MLKPSGPTLFYELYYKLTGGCELSASSIRRICNLLNPVIKPERSLVTSHSYGLNFDLYNSFINDLVENIKCLFTKFVVELKKKKR